MAEKIYKYNEPNPKIIKRIKSLDVKTLWWLRSPDNELGHLFCRVLPDGSCNHSNTYTANDTIGVAPGFCI